MEFRSVGICIKLILGIIFSPICLFVTQGAIGMIDSVGRRDGAVTAEALVTAEAAVMAEAAATVEAAVMAGAAATVEAPVMAGAAATVEAPVKDVVVLGPPWPAWIIWMI